MLKDSQWILEAVLWKQVPLCVEVVIEFEEGRTGGGVKRAREKGWEGKAREGRG